MKNLRYLRERAGLTQLALAIVLGVDRSAVANWELGTKNPNAARLPKLAAALGCSIDELYSDAEKAG